MNTFRIIIFSLVCVLIFLKGPTSYSYAQERPLFETTKIADDVYMFRYRNHNGMFVITADGVMAVDPISVEAAKIYVQEIRKITDKPIKYLIYSHHHFDHITGGKAFGEGIEIIAHRKTKERLVKLNNPNIPLPTITFEDRYVIEGGGKKVELVSVGSPHGDNMIVVYLPEMKILFAVDFIANKRVGFRFLPDFHFPDLIESLQIVDQLDFNTLVLGHGPPGTKDTIKENIEYWNDLSAEVKKFFDQGLSVDEIKEKVRLPKYENWGGYKEWFPMNVERMYFHYHMGGW